MAIGPGRLEYVGRGRVGLRLALGARITAVEPAIHLVAICPDRGEIIKENHLHELLDHVLGGLP